MCFGLEVTMNSHMLINYGIIRSFHDSGKSVTDTLMPFVEYGLSQIAIKKCDHYDKSSLKKIIFDETGININDLTLTNLLKKLQKKGVIYLLDNNQYFKILQNKRIQIESYVEKTDSFKRQINKFIDEYKRYSNDVRTENEIKEYLFEVLKCKDLRLGSSVDSDYPDLSKYNDMFSFIQHISHQEDELYNIFCDINFGYTLCSLIEKEKQIEKIKLNDFVIYLDSNFVLRLLDLQEECYSVETKELFDLLSTSGAKIKIFEETIDEVINVIEHYKSRYIKEKDHISSIIQASNINGVYGSFYRRGLTVSQIDDIIDNVHNTISSLGIEKDQISRYKLNINENEVEKLYEKKYYDVDASEKEYRVAKCRNYISIIHIIKWLRRVKNVHANCFGNSKYIFLTCDWRLYRYNLVTSNKHNYPEIIIQESIVDNLMLFFPERYSEISTELILSVYKSSQYLNVHDLSTFADNINTIVKEDPQMTSYVVKITKNIEYYDDIARLYSDDSQNPMIGLKTLIDEQRKKDEIENIETAKEQQNELAKKYEEGKKKGLESGENAGYIKGKSKGFEEGKNEGIIEGKNKGFEEGQNDIIRVIAKKRLKQKNIVKGLGLISLFVIPTALSILIICNVIDVSELQIGETAKWIISTLISISCMVTSVILSKNIDLTEEDEYRKLVAKFKDKNTL